MIRRLPFLVASAALAAAAGCVAAVPRELLDAQTEYETASRGPAGALAPVRLHEAEKALDRANREYAKHPRSKQVADLAYVAKRRVEIAESEARAEQARRYVASVEGEARARMLAQGGSWRAQQDLAEAERLRQAQEDAERARAAQAQAEQRARDAEAQAAQREEADRLAREQQAREAEAQRQQQEALTKAQEADRKAQEALERLEKIAQVREEPRGTVITLSGSLLFATGQSELLPQAQSRLTEVAEALKQSPDTQLRIEGHTDARGTETLNQDLSVRRAEAVRNFLENRGIDPERIAIVGYGSSRPIADNRTPDGRAMNRRVEIVLKPRNGVGGAGR